MKSQSSPALSTRHYGIFAAVCLVAANIIGAGIFTTTGYMATYLPNPLWILTCWILGGCLALSGALCYTELASRIPRSGGEYIFLKELFHPILGFLTGWTSFLVGFSVAIALSSMGFAAYFVSSISPFLKEISPDRIAITKKIMAVFIIMTFTLIHSRGAKTGSRIQIILTVTNIFLLGALVVGGLFFGEGNWENVTARPSIPLKATGLGTAMVMTMYAYSGWNASAYITGELKNPRRNIFISLTLGTLVVMILYIGVNTFILYATPFKDLGGVLTVVEKASVNAFGSWTAYFISGLIAAILMTSASAYIVLGPRVYQAMAKDGMFFHFASQTHPKFGVPSRAILVQGIVASLMVIIGSFEQLLIYLGFSLGIFPWLSIAGVFKARRMKLGEESAIRIRGVKFFALFYLVLSFLLMTFTYINKPKESSIAIVTVLLGIPVYFLWNRIRQRMDLKK